MNNYLFLFLFLANFAKALPLSVILQEQNSSIAHKIASYAAKDLNQIERNLNDMNCLVSNSKINNKKEEYCNTTQFIRNKIPILLFFHSKIVFLRKSVSKFFIAEHNLSSLINSYNDLFESDEKNDEQKGGKYILDVKFLSLLTFHNINMARYSMHKNKNLRHERNNIPEDAAKKIPKDGDSACAEGGDVELDGLKYNFTPEEKEFDLYCNRCVDSQLFFSLFINEDLLQYPILRNKNNSTILIRLGTKLRNFIARNESNVQLLKQKENSLISIFRHCMHYKVRDVENLNDMFLFFKLLLSLSDDNRFKIAFEYIVYSSRKDQSQEEWHDIYSKLFPIFLKSLLYEKSERFDPVTNMVLPYIDFKILSNVQTGLLRFFASYMVLQDISIITAHINKMTESQLKERFLKHFNNINFSWNNKLANNLIEEALPKNMEGMLDQNIIKRIKIVLTKHSFIERSFETIFIKIIRLIYSNNQYHKNNIEFLTAIKQDVCLVLKDFKDKDECDLLIKDMDFTNYNLKNQNSC